MPTPKQMKALAAKQRSRAAKWKRVTFKDNRLPETKGMALSGGGCWCGLSFDHDWPNRASGAPHPVTRGIAMVPPEVVKREAKLALQAAGVCPYCRGYPPLRKMPVGEPEPWCPVCLGSGTFPPPKPSLRLKAKKKEHPSEEEKEVAEPIRDFISKITNMERVPQSEEVEEQQPEPEQKAKPMTQAPNSAPNYSDEAVAALATALTRLPDNWIQCRDMRHAWKVRQDFHVEESEPGTRQLTQIGRTLECTRCKTHRVEHYVSRNGIGLEKVKQYYMYPDGYQIHGVPRGVKPQSIVQEEQYNRAMERMAILASRSSDFHDGSVVPLIGDVSGATEEN